MTNDELKAAVREAMRKIFVSPHVQQLTRKQTEIIESIILRELLPLIDADRLKIEEQAEYMKATTGALAIATSEGLQRDRKIERLEKALKYYAIRGSYLDDGRCARTALGEE